MECMFAFAQVLVQILMQREAAHDSVEVCTRDQCVAVVSCVHVCTRKQMRGGLRFRFVRVPTHRKNTCEYTHAHTKPHTHTFVSSRTCIDLILVFVFRLCTQEIAELGCVQFLDSDSNADKTAFQRTWVRVRRGEKGSAGFRFSGF